MELRPYQKAAVSALLNFWRDVPTGVPLIVCPTGSGKSLIIGKICQLVRAQRPEYRVLVVSHRKEIISQNSRAISKLLNDSPVGVYSAGLGLKQLRSITCCNIQSIYKKDLPPCELIIVDECHLISSNSDSMYQKFLSSQRAKNKNVKVFGLTATPYRMDRGHLVGDLFTDIAYDISILDLLNDKFLASVVSLPGKTKTDLSSVKMSGYDYNQGDLQDAFDIKELVEAHVSEIVDAGLSRKHWLIFSSGVKHARDLCEEFLSRGIRAEYVTGEMLAIQRDQILNRFKSGETRCLINCDILTTGFDFPAVDLLAIIRATKSAGLYVQIVGRGMRICDGKTSCLLLDFGGNIERHGPIDCISVGRKKDQNGKALITVLPTKECGECGAIISSRFQSCPHCGCALPKVVTDITKKASNVSPISKPEEYEVSSTDYKIHNKIGSPPMLRIDYHQGLRTISDFLCFEHGGFATHMAGRKWLQLGGKSPVPSSSVAAFDRRKELRLPQVLEVIKSGKYWRVIKILSEKKVDTELFDKYGLNL